VGLTFESIVVKDKYKHLFDEQTVIEAAERHKKFTKSSSYGLIIPPP